MVRKMILKRDLMMMEVSNLHFKLWQTLFEKAAADKTNEVVDDDDALEKEGEVRVDDALEKEGEVGVDDALKEAASVGVNEMPKRVPKRSHLLRSSFTPN
ncbi:hypothetical protein DY000_02034184 [Brassica cretica]|uniref:Uncharacterized protein n=1 Tax=Brassica cretica TaxID=69181 RepID=A0ABQ7DU13_BRACR|nr:hypothetical protein DY000_02034184 [Brassica cretica]